VLRQPYVRTEYGWRARGRVRAWVWPLTPSPAAGVASIIGLVPGSTARASWVRGTSVLSGMGHGRA
jgi:hypothetical protein